MRCHGRLILSVLFALIFLTSLAALATLGLDYRQGAEEYDRAKALAGLKALPVSDPDPTPSTDGRNGAVELGSTASAMEQNPPPDEACIPAAPDLAALREVNPDVAFWLLIPDTAISYPVVQGTDNSFYLTHTWTGQRNRVGAIFLDQRCSVPLGGFNTVVYGHHMKDGSMFAALAGYAEQSFQDAHPAIYLFTDGGRIRCEVFAAYETEVTSCVYQLDFPTEEDRQAFLEECLAHSVIDTEITPTAQDRILTLSTCTASGSRRTRWVVQGVLYEEE